MTQENNKLIAEFMELIESSISNKYWTEKSKEGFGQGELIDLQYHTDWNELHKVVNKIEDYLFKNKGKVGYFDDCLNSNDIEVRYQAVVELIKFYNEQNK